MDSQFGQVIASFQRARQADEFFDTFYQLFLRKSPEIPPMFAQTDFPHQKMMLRESILEMLLFAEVGSGRAELERLARYHHELNVRPAHFEMWLEALCEALSIHDPQFNAELAQHWRTALRPGLEIMVAEAASTGRGPG